MPRWNESVCTRYNHQIVEHDASHEAGIDGFDSGFAELWESASPPQKKLDNNLEQVSSKSPTQVLLPNATLLAGNRHST